MAPQGSASQPAVPVSHSSDLESAAAQYARVQAELIRAEVGLVGVQQGSSVQGARVGGGVKQGGGSVQSISKVQLVTRPGTTFPATSGGSWHAACRCAS